MGGFFDIDLASRELRPLAVVQRSWMSIIDSGTNLPKELCHEELRIGPLAKYWKRLFR